MSYFHLTNKVFIRAGYRKYSLSYYKHTNSDIQDRWVFEVLDPKKRRQMKSLKSTVQWTDLVAMKMKELHADGITREQVEESLRQMPFHPAMKRGLINLKERNKDIDLVILSNSNEVYIRTILEHHKITHLFDSIITNRASWTEDGCLDLKRRVDPNGEQHKCVVGCSPNMCKGKNCLFK